MDRFASFQRDIDATSAPDYEAFRAAGPDMPAAARDAALVANPGLRRYDEAFDRVFRDVRDTRVDGAPAVWLLYNMGLVVKTPASTFAIDLVHRQGLRLAPMLDFALVTHNHPDHVDEGLLAALDHAGKTVVSNFLCNYGAVRRGSMPGGYARGRKVLEIRDVTVRTADSDHNGYLVDFTSAFEISVGDWTLYHTGDSSTLSKLAPARTPDLWVVHPRCGLDVADAVRAFHPRRTAICHLCELGHPPKEWRWSTTDGLEDAARAAEAGTDAFVPLWGERIA